MKALHPPLHPHEIPLGKRITFPLVGLFLCIYASFGLDATRNVFSLINGSVGKALAIYEAKDTNQFNVLGIQEVNLSQLHLKYLSQRNLEERLSSLYLVNIQAGEDLYVVRCLEFSDRRKAIRGLSEVNKCFESSPILASSCHKTGRIRSFVVVIIAPGDAKKEPMERLYSVVHENFSKSEDPGFFIVD